MNTRIFCCSTIRLSATLWTAVLLCLTLATSVTAASYTVTVSSDGKNAVGNGTYTEGTTVSVTAGTHPDGIPFKKWTVQKGGVKLGDAYSEKTTFVMPKRNVTLIAEFGILRKKAMNAAADDSVSYGGKKYGWVTIGTRKWMTENLNYVPESGNSWCYENSADSCEKYGRLYDWATAMGEGASNSAVWNGNYNQNQGICPAGWRLPSDDEWRALNTYAGVNTAGTKLKAKDGWTSGNGTDDYGFSALPGGGCTGIGTGCKNVGSWGEWWVTKEYGGSYPTYAYYYYITTGDPLLTATTLKASGHSVRCVAYTQEKYTVNIIRDGGAGESGGDWKPYDEVTITAGTAPAGKKFRVWTTQSSGVTFASSYAETTTFTMPANDVTVAAVYVDEFTDSRDSKKYGMVTIGTRKWMADNLNYQPATGNSWCYGNSADSCAKYGRLYDWTTAMGIEDTYKNTKWSGNDFQQQGVCPTGWRMPNNDDWSDLITYAGGAANASTKLKARSGWSAGGNGTDDYGFSALPGSYYTGSTFTSHSPGTIGEWWTSTPAPIADQAYGFYMQLGSGNDPKVLNESTFKRYGISVRCVAYTQEKYTVTVNGDGNTGATGGGDYEPGEKVSINAGTAPAGKYFVKWTTPNTSVVFEDAYSAATAFTMPGGSNVTVMALFGGSKYRVTVVNAGEGASGGGDYVVGGRVTVKAGTAPTDKKFYMWTTENKDVDFDFDYGATTTFIMPGNNVTVSAEFRETFKDGRDGKTYRSVTIGKQKWMAENLNYDPLKSTGSWCYENNADSCGKYGRLYDWATAMNIDASYNTTNWTDPGITQQGICPNGWHLPKTAEWDTLMKYGGYGNGLYAKKGWEKFNILTNGIDAYGFTALPGGTRDENGIFSSSSGKLGGWRVTMQGNATVASIEVAGSTDDYPQPSIVTKNYAKTTGFSVRCVINIKTQVTMPTFTPVDFVYDGKKHSAGIAGNDHYTVINGERTDAGICTTRVVLKDTLIYEWSDGSNKPLEFKWSIEKAPARPFIRPEARVVYSTGLKLEGVSLPEGYAWADTVKATVLKETDDGRSFAATYTDPSGNYYTAYGYITVKFVTDAQRTYKVVISNGGAGASDVKEYAKDATVTVTAGTHPQEFLFRKWTTQSNGVTLADVYSKTTTFTMPENDVTVTAEWVMSFVDNRDDKKYRMVNIGGKRWMAENLNYEPPNDTGSRCYGNTSAETAANCEKYGRLYNWPSAMAIDQSYIKAPPYGTNVFNHRGVCPVGWHLPDTAEWNSLVKEAGGSSIAGEKLKATSDWVNFSGVATGNGTDDFGFSALPGGITNANAPGGTSIGINGYWWSSIEWDAVSYTSAWRMLMTYSTKTGEMGGTLKNTKESVRCIADKSVVAKPTVTNTSLTYNGYEQWAGIPVSPVRAYDVDGADAINVGDHIATVTLDAANFMWADGDTSRVLKLHWSISPAPGKFPVLVKDTTYSSTLKLTDFKLPKGYGWAVSTDSTAHLSAGDGQTFAATFTDTSGNYTTASGVITVNVAKATGLKEIAPTTLKISSDNTGTNVFDLSGIILEPTDHGKLSYALGDETDGGGSEGKILQHAPTLANTLLSYQGSGKKEGTAAQVIKVTSQNYEGIDITVTFEATPEAVYAVTVTGGVGGGSYKAGDTVSITAAPADPGKVFVKWTTQSGVAFMPDSSAAEAKFTMPSRDVAVTAVYGDTVYKVLFMAEGGVVSPEFGMTVRGTGKLALLPDPVRIGYVFDGWYTDGGDRVELSTPFRSDVAIFAKWVIVEYKVVWEVDGGAPEPAQKIATYVSGISAPDTVRKAGYIFRGWYTDLADSTTKAVFPIKNVAADVTFYAKWELNSYVIWWYTNGGTAAPYLVSAVAYGGVIEESPVSAGSKAGYAFDGWYNDEALKSPVTFPVTDINGKKEFYAKWVPEYRVTFNANGGAVTPASALTGAGGKLASLPVPTRSGYTFEGWYKSDSVEVKENTVFSGNTTVYAHWTRVVYMVTFWPLGGGTVTPSLISVGTNGKLPYWPTIITTPDCGNTCNYVFAGWYNTNEGASKLDAKDKVDTNTVVFNANAMLYTGWRRVDFNVYTITFNPTGGTVSPMDGATIGDSTLAISLPVPTKSGYTFAGWYTDSTGGTQVTSSTKFTANTTVYAHWTTGAVSYTIVFNANGGAVSPTSGKTGAGGMLSSSLPTPTRSGYVFDAWYTTQTAGSKVTQSTAFTSNDTIYARWTLITYTVTFMPNGGTVTPASVLAGADGKLSLLPIPKLNLYAFDGWYTEPTGGAKVTLSTVFHSDAAVFARWIPLYIIRYNANGGTVSLAVDTTGADGKLAALPTPKPANNGETFDGWYTSPVGGAKVTASTVFTGDVTLYAHWSPAAVSYTVTFNANGGLVNPTSRVTAGNGTLASLPTPAREGYAFIGWYASATVGSTVITTSYVFDANATIYARWTPIYTVTFNANGGAVSPANAKIEADGTLYSLPEPTRSGYAFAGWFTTSAATGGLEVTTEYVFSANTTIYARWTLMTYTIIFNANGGTVTVSSGVTGTGGRLSSLPTPSARTGYVFDGWYTDWSGGNKVTTSTAFTGDATVYAQWSPVYKVTFDPNGGTVSTASANTGAGGKLTSLPTPTLREYTFVAWYTEKEGGARVTTSTAFTGDATVYAKWSLLSEAAVTFGAGANGTLRATVDGLPIATGAAVGIGKDIIFTAVPNDGYKVSRWTINGTEIADTFFTYIHAGLSNVASVSVTFERRTSVASPNREIPSGAVTEEVTITPVKTLSGAVTVGPNPVRAGSVAAIYWTGGKAVSGKLTVFDALGGRVAVVDVSTSTSLSDRGAKKIGEWKVGDIAEGTYLIRGVLKDKNGVKVKVSVLVGVVR